MTKEVTATTAEAPAQSSPQLYLISALAQAEESLELLVNFLKEKGVEIKKSENLGPRQLFSPINKYTQLLLFSIFFELETAALPLIEKALRHEEYVERFLVTTWRGPLESKPRSHRYNERKKEREHVQP